MFLPHVGHCPSCAAIDSVASRRDEQYPQLNPYRRPGREVLNRPSCSSAEGDGPRGMVAVVVPPPPAEAPAPTMECSSCAARAAAAAGTRSVVRQVGHRTSCPACDSSAESEVLQTWQGKTSIRL